VIDGDAHRNALGKPDPGEAGVHIGQLRGIA
jgi:hypothetical protein